MREQFERRLRQLKDEYAQGEKTLEELQTKTVGVQRVMLRLSGAIQVLEEELGEGNAPSDTSAASATANSSHSGYAGNGAEPGVSSAPMDTAALPGENVGHGF